MRNSYNLFVSPLASLASLRWVGSAAICAVLFGTSVAANAAGVLGNLPPTNDGVSSIFNTTFQRAVIFTTGSDAYDLTNVRLRLNNYVTTGGSPDTARVGIFQDNGSGTNTEAQVGSFFTSPLSASTATTDFTFTPSGALTLNANTKYWLLLDVTAGDFGWSGSNPGLTPTGTGATYDLIKASSDNGANYATSSSVLNSFQINGTVVPEPATLSLLALSALVAIRRAR